MLCGVGGQGLVLTSGIITEVAMRSGYDVKSNDVIGLSQRGGRVWANIRIGEKVYSPNTPVGETDFLLALEPLEGYRYTPMLKKEGVVFMNDRKVFPSDVVFDKDVYPEAAIDQMKKTFESYALDATEAGKEMGNKMVANTIMLGMLAAKMTMDKSIWETVILENVPEKAKEVNQKAFDFGFEFVNQ
jgi:indolepyruvate ferredoxin oxidoreductase beta subunit